MRIKKLWITMILICCGLLCFVACKMESAVQSISVKGYSAETVIEVPFGNFSYGNYTVLVTYENGETEEIALTEDMIPETEKLKFFQVGESNVTIAYKGATTSIAIKISRYEFPENVQLNGFTETYTGQPFVVEVEGDIPGGTKILYPQGNTFQDAGSYDMTAVLQCDGYVTKTLSAHIQIDKKTYELSAKLYETSFTYDRDPHSITVKGAEIKDENNKTIGYEPTIIPEGVTVSYTITNSAGQEVDKAVNVGEYTVTATFKGNNSNYIFNEDEDVSTALMIIEPATYETSKVEFIGKTVTYTGDAYSLSIKESTLPKNVEVSYEMTRVKDWEGKEEKEIIPISEGATEPGVYKVVANFNVIKEYETNYTIDEYKKEAYLTIVRYVYENSKIGFSNRIVSYTGTAYSLNIDEENMPEDVEVSYKIVKVENGVDGEAIAGNSATEIGEYKVIASFKVSAEAAPYYTMDLSEKEAYLTIQPASYDDEIWTRIDMEKTVRLDQTEYVFTTEEACEIYLTYDLPEGVTPKLALINDAGEAMKCETVEEVVTEDGAGATYRYVFNAPTVGEYTCVLTFEHSNEKYLPITVKLEAPVNIMENNS